MSSKFTYTVDENTFHVRIYVEGQEAPIISQPQIRMPDAPESMEASVAWAEKCIASLEHSASLLVENNEPEPEAPPEEPPAEPEEQPAQPENNNE